MDFTRVLGALLGGAAQPARRRRSARAPLGGSGMEARAARALGALAAGALAEWMKPGPQPRPEPPPRASKAPSPTRAPKAAAPARRLPQTGASPWATRQPEPTPIEPTSPGAEQAEALLLIRAMIAAAKADGTVDAAERAAIAGQLDTAGLSAEERDFVLADFEHPMTPDALAREARDPMLRARVYAAAFVGVGEVSATERAWLDRLAKALQLDKAAAAAIEERLA